MTKTPVVQRFALSARLSRTGKASLTEPFLSNKDGKVHTTGAIERSSMCERWLVLVHASFFMACNYYCYDIPAALYRPLGRAFWFERNFEYYFDMLYSIYSVPNIILPLFGGLLIDKVGLYFSLKLFSALLLAGQMIFALGCTISSLPLMLVGRFVFGLGAAAHPLPVHSCPLRRSPSVPISNMQAANPFRLRSRRSSSDGSPKRSSGWPSAPRSRSHGSARSSTMRCRQPSPRLLTMYDRPTMAARDAVPSPSPPHVHSMPMPCPRYVKPFIRAANMTTKLCARAAHMPRTH